MIAGIESPAGAADDWEDLAGRCDAPPYHRPGWFAAWAAAFRPDAAVTVVTLRDRAGTLRALAPVIREGGTTVSPTNEHSPGYGCVADSPEALAGLAAALLGTGSSLRLGPLADADPLRAGVREQAARRRHIVMERPMLRSPYLDIPDDGPLAALSRGMRKEIGRGRRRLQELGEVRLEIARTPEEAGPALRDLLDIEARGWKGEDGTAISSRPETLAFYTAVTRWAAETGRLRLGVLRVDGRAAAAELDLAEGSSVFSLKAGFDPHFARQGPGHVLVAELLEALRHEGVRRYEMLGDDDAYKMRWTDTVREMVEVATFAPTPRGLARLGRARVAPAVARRVRRAAGRAGIA